MHVLVTNDDGPPCDIISPFIHHLIEALKKNTDWDISVALPNSQKSWIGKAHMIGQTITASYITPSKVIGEPYTGPYDQPKNNGEEEWILLDGTPATCSNIGVNHLFKRKGPVDLVISGPNLGGNSGAVFIMSSGTVGAAMEGALCGVKSIGLSYAYKTKEHDTDVVIEATRLGVEIVKHLYENWPKDDSVDLYSVNIPLVDTLSSSTPIIYSDILQNKWVSAFTPVTNHDKGTLQFEWTPDFDYVHRNVLKAGHGDSYIVHQGSISVTPLRASFQGVSHNSQNINTENDKKFLLTLDDGSYLYPVLKEAVRTHLPYVKLITSADEASPNDQVFQYGEYEDLDFDKLMENTSKYMACSYIYRKALIRKHYLSNTVAVYKSKNPESLIASAFPDSYNIEVDYAEFLDDALDEAYELRGELEAGDKIWILKPSMSDRGQGIRLFSSVEGLQAIFDEFEEDSDGEDSDMEEAIVFSEPKSLLNENSVVTSQLRHFIVQSYIDKPLLLPQHNNRKFHIRTYVLCVGAVKVYVYKHMLALFALSDYKPPQADENDIISLYGQLTNTCLQGECKDEGSVHSFWSLNGLETDKKEAIFSQLCTITGELFDAAVSAGSINFQPLPNGFEIYGIDYLVDSNLSVHLLEVNAYPDFKQTGDDLKSIISGLFNDVIQLAVKPFFGETATKSKDLIEVLDRNVSGGW
ncbi:TTL-domain-containing protein [Nadsonia fulvescens var. elongata DSM 6958]|uniref:TTL-domain-containing protein n=1 Tax=Nadsonia fulvescens var. elongata DSM 6958 TaxID=857566 RepID=A0A1E3PSR9_9ASCO|nr:TTL-domain-containing protein [Nadsonia fulvescens var. elongata DSM 6958]